MGMKIQNKENNSEQESDENEMMSFDNIQEEAKVTCKSRIII